MNLKQAIKEGKLKEFIKEHLKEKGDKGKYVSINKEEYENMTSKVVDENSVAQTIIHGPINANLLLKKPDLLGNSKWEFMFLGKSIRAEIKDIEWLKKVHAGEITGFGSKVTIPVRIMIQYDVDVNYDTIPNTHKYTILKVTGDITQPIRPYA